MKNKIQKKIKKNIFSFIVGTIIFGVINVYAVTYYASSATIYDNSASKMKSTNVQNAIDELYNTCFPPTASATIIENGNLKKDPYECRYFFTGANPNNYITFNGEKAGWRIISVECDEKIKIMKIANINTNNNLEWDTYDRNNWTRPATLNTYLNKTYYNNLNSAAQSQIVASDFSIGEVGWENTNISGQVSNENSNKWNGKIALPTASEYIRTNSNKTSCDAFYSINDNYTTCKKTTWMCNNDSWWTLSAMSNTNYMVFAVGAIGSIYRGSAYERNIGIRPALYLSSDVQITGGNGTQNNPYTIT